MKKIYRTFLLSLILVLSLASGVFAQNTELPKKYDLRNVNGKNYVTSVKFQNPWGTCWSFATMAACETNALLKGAPSDIDLSERSLAWFNSRMQKNPNTPDKDYEGYYTLSSQGFPEDVDMDTWAALNTGGGGYYSINQLSTWYGSNTEANAPYINDQGLMDGNEPAVQGTWSLPYSMYYNQEVHLQNGDLVYSPAVDSGNGVFYNTQPLEFATQMKQAILEHGAVLIAYGAVQDPFIGDQFYNSKTAAYYNFDAPNNPPDHGVTVVGWDDTYSASNFGTTPPGDGAYIVKNSWGTSYGDEGYFYLSYYDTSLQYFTWFDVETPDIQGGYSYDNIYQYDLLGAKSTLIYSRMADLADLMKESGLEAGNVSFASVFKTDHAETLQAVSAFNPILNAGHTLANCQLTTDIVVYVLNDNYSSPTDGTVAATGSVTTNNYGIRTVKLDTPVKLPAGTAFSVVETQVASWEEDGVTVRMPMIAMEYGLEEPSETNLQGPDGSYIGTSIQAVRARAQAGQSFIYGLSGGNGWDDVTSEAVSTNDQIRHPIVTDSGDETIDNQMVVGNALIKAYTTDDEEVPPTPIRPDIDEINLTPEASYLSTLPGTTNSVTISASFEPEGAYVEVDNLKWSCSDQILDMQVDPSNLSVTVTAKAEGYGVVECFNGAKLGIAAIRVSNQPIVSEGITVDNTSPDYFNITVEDVKPNPAFPTAMEADSVSIFSWSELNQSDINAKRVSRADGSNDFVLENIPVNDNAQHNFFLSADNITINAYANSGGNTYWLESANTSWVEGQMLSPQSPYSLYPRNNIFTYTTYGQNVGFVKPSVLNPNTSGVLEDPNSSFLTGIRVSCNVMGMAVSQSVYSQGTGWISGGDGDFVGNMEGRPIEAMSLDLSGPYEAQMHGTITYRAYIEGVGWTDWAPKGATVGTPDSGQPIVAIELNITRDR